MSFSNDKRISITNADNYENYDFLLLGMKSYIAESYIEAVLPSNIMIGNYSSIAHEIRFNINLNHDYLSVSTYPWDVIYEKKFKYKINRKRQIIIGNDVTIGTNVTIMGGVNIGNGAVIGANVL